MPALGNPSFAFLAGGALPWAPSLAIYGGAALALPPSMRGAALWVDPTCGWFGALFQLADGQGRCELPLAIPSDPGLAGLPLHVQFASLDGCAPGGVAASYALGIVMQ